MFVCMWIAQDRAHLTQVLSHRPIVHCPSEHWLLFGAPLWGVDFSIGMADVAISVEDSLDDSDLSCSRTATGHEMRPEDDSDLGRTRTATGHKKRSCSLTAAPRDEELAAERLRHIPFFITSSYYTCTFPYPSSAYCKYIHTLRGSLLCYYSTFIFINCFMVNVEVQGMCLCIAYA